MTPSSSLKVELPVDSSTLSEGWKILTLNENKGFFFVLFCLRLGSLETETDCRIQGKHVFEECSSEKVIKVKEKKSGKVGLGYDFRIHAI